MKRELKRIGAGLCLTAAVAFGSFSMVQPAAAAEQAAVKVEIYTTNWCGYCKQAVAYLKKNRIPYTEYDVEQDAAAARRWQEISSGGGVPVAVIGKKVIRGYSPEVYKEALSSAGSGR